MYNGPWSQLGDIVNLLELTGFENWELYLCLECIKLGTSSQTCVGVDASLLPRAICYPQFRHP